jgi:hypothetical protein
MYVDYRPPTNSILGSIHQYPDSAAKRHAQLKVYSVDEEGVVTYCAGANQSSPRNGPENYFSFCI